MKNIFTFLAISIFFFIFTSCNSEQKRAVDSNSNKNQYIEQKAKLTGVLKQKVGSWAKEGEVCYGVVVATNSKGKAEYGKPVKAKIIVIESNRIKMKALEDVNLGEKKSCSKLTVSSGTVWWEKDGDLFKTKKEAVSFLMSKRLLK